MEHLKIPLGSSELKGHVQTIYTQSKYLESMPPEVHSAIAALARDRGFQEALKQRNQHHAGDNLDFFLDSIARLFSPGYLPSDEDILRSQVSTQGVTETIFTAEKGSQGDILKLDVYDIGGSRPCRKKWKHLFKEADLVLFTVDIGSYDQVFFENRSTNSMQEALMLWDSIVNSRWFTETTFILCFTKQAKLAAKIKDAPLALYFPGFVASDLPDLDSATNYINHYFLSFRQAPERPTYTMVLPDLPTKEDWEAMKNFFWEVHERKMEKLSSGAHF
ncbi:hypothetical protein EPUS_06472 [Endocarpon pusillum Z07020]|uniref:Guanine nucleotide-binding protein alpha-2 subunit n=1 Tax=Endocarpon pusillum (strain Z07020 / HMAS-L-300199) TaxID=1263415 RepID=U1GHN9_ENDPU|nr:uncharacterized protein EPUS_06472 [Endocarpon pusillum Z07020]ERF77192.1 hypothetical protein EPUS_06472 [Endocarpon pusillum Z07020]